MKESSRKPAHAAVPLWQARASTRKNWLAIEERAVEGGRAKPGLGSSPPEGGREAGRACPWVGGHWRPIAVLVSRGRVNSFLCPVSPASQHRFDNS